MKIPLVEIIYNKNIYDLRNIKKELEEAEIQVVLSTHERIEVYKFVIFIDKNKNEEICNIDIKKTPYISKDIITYFEWNNDITNIKNKELINKK